MSGKVLTWEVKKRTFEGKLDKEKNNNTLTSEFFPSLKYIALYKVQFVHGGIADCNDCFRTKQEAINQMEQYERYGYGS